MTKKELFSHKILVSVRFNEVDMLGVCNNAVYLSYFEEARIQYLKSAGLIPVNGLFSDGAEYYVVRNEINYYSFARYDDKLEIWSRIQFIRNSSYGFEHIVINSESEEIIADGIGIIVKVNPVTKKATPLDDEFYKKILKIDPLVEIRRAL